MSKERRTSPPTDPAAEKPALTLEEVAAQVGLLAKAVRQLSAANPSP